MNHVCVSLQQKYWYVLILLCLPHWMSSRQTGRYVWALIYLLETFVVKLLIGAQCWVCHISLLEEHEMCLMHSALERSTWQINKVRFPPNCFPHIHFPNEYKHLSLRLENILLWSFIKSNKIVQLFLNFVFHIYLHMNSRLISFYF